MYMRPLDAMLIRFRTKSFEMSIISRICIKATRIGIQFRFYIPRNILIYIPIKRSFSRFRIISFILKPLSMSRSSCWRYTTFPPNILYTILQKPQRPSQPHKTPFPPGRPSRRRSPLPSAAPAC